MTLKEALNMEFRVCMGFMRHNDCGEFYEGVRALLKDKDMKPKWKYQSIDQVTFAEIDWFFNRNDD